MAYCTLELQSVAAAGLAMAHFNLEFVTREIISDTGPTLVCDYVSA